MKGMVKSMAELDSIRRMPYSVEAEQAILGTIIVDPNRYDDVSFLSSEEFYLEQHQQIFSAMTDMVLSNRIIDLVTLISALTQTGNYTEGDAGKYIKLLVDVSANASNIAEYGKIVRDKALLRMLIDATRDISDRAFSEIGEVSDILELAEQRIYEISDNTYRKNFEHVRDAILRNYDTLNLLKNDPESLMGLRTNYEGLDQILIGLGSGDLVIVGGRPGMGKTSFCLNIASNIAKNTKKDVAIFSLEMTSEQLASRLLCAEALIDSKCMRTGKLSAEEWKRLAEAASALSATNIVIDDTSDITVAEMKSKLRKLKNLGLIVIDYLQLMHGEKSMDNRVLEVAQITRSLKIMAKEFGVPIILCSQLSRGPKDQREGKKPSLTDLRDSGSIEQDADIVLLLYRAEYYKTADRPATEMSDHELCDCIVAKNRHGATGTVRLAWYGRHFRFVTSDEREDAPAG